MRPTILRLSGFVYDRQQSKALVQMGAPALCQLPISHCMAAVVSRRLLDTTKPVNRMPRNNVGLPSPLRVQR